jgi:uncharacterized protein (TIGR03663 family)
MADDSRAWAVLDALPIPGDRTFKTVLVLTALSLAVRLVDLGHRVAQWDEGRVAYWVLRYRDSGVWEYRPIVHGPFLFHVDKWVFTLFPATDFTLRLVVALLGGLMPLAAWLFREHLRKSEVVALALVFAFNPLLVYYSRFFRNDVVVAAFVVFALGLFVRTYDTRNPTYLYGGVAAVALAFTAKENALIYPLCWAGAAVLLLDHRLLRVGERARRAAASATGREVATDGGDPDDTEDPNDDADTDGEPDSASDDQASGGDGPGADWTNWDDVDEAADRPDPATADEDGDADGTSESVDDAETVGAEDGADGEVVAAEDEDDAAPPADNAESGDDATADAATGDDASSDDAAGDADRTPPDDQEFLGEPDDPHGDGPTAPPNGPPDGADGPFDYLLDWVSPYAARLGLIAAAVVAVLLNPIVLSKAAAFLRSAGVPVGFLDLAPLALAAGGVAFVEAVQGERSPRVYVTLAASYVGALGLWGFAPEPGVVTVTYVIVYALWLVVLLDVAAFGRESSMEASLPVAYGIFLFVIVFFYAPRAAGTEGIGLYKAFGQPTMFPPLVHEALFGSWEKFVNLWASGSHQRHAYMPFFEDYVGKMRVTAAVVAPFAVVGFVYDRYLDEGPRDLVSLAFYWGAVSVLGYPIITDIKAPWAVVHAVVPLAIPAAVGLALLYRWTRASYRDGQLLQTTAAVTLVVLVVAWTGGVGYYANFADSDEAHNEEFAHWTQPDNDLRHTLEKIEAVAAYNDGHDVMFYGSRKAGSSDTLFYVADEAANEQPPPGGGWYGRLPLPWYMERYDANVTSTPPTGSPAEKLEDAPPVIVAYAWDRSEIKPYADGYVMYRHEFKLWAEDIVVFIDRSTLEAATGESVRGSAAMRPTGHARAVAP